MKVRSYLLKEVREKSYSGRLVNRIFGTVVFSIYNNFKGVYKLFLGVVCKITNDKVEFFTSRKKNVSYVVNSKCACSSIKRMMLEAEGLDCDNLESYSDIHEVANSGGFNVTPRSSDFVFTVVRNPFDRLVSLYVNKFEDTDKIKKTRFEYSNYLFGVLKQDMSFLEFIKAVSVIPDILADRHFKSQSYLLNETGRDVQVYKLENLDTKFKDDMETKGMIIPKKQNQSSPYDISDYLCRESYALIIERYAEDIDRFDYHNTKEMLKNRLDMV